MKKKIFRYPASAFFFLAGILVACVALFDLMGIYSDLQNQEEDADYSVYPIEAVMQVDLGDRQAVGIYELEQLLPSARLEEMPINIQLADVMVPYSEDSTVGTLQVMFYYGIPTRFQLESGSLPGMDGGISGVAVGRANRDLIHTENDGSQYIYLNRYEKIPVTGILGGSSSDYQDRFLVADYAGLSENLKEMISANTSFLELHIQTEESENIDCYAQTLASIIREAVPTANITAAVVLQEGGGTVHIYESHVRFAVWVYGFCIGIFLVISRFWISQREKEMAVRKAYGMSGWQLGCLLIRDCGLILAGALVLYGMIHGIGCLMGWIHPIRLNWRNGAVLSFFLVLTVAACVGIPIWRCRQIQPSQLLKEYED